MLDLKHFWECIGCFVNVFYSIGDPKKNVFPNLWEKEERTSLNNLLQEVMETIYEAIPSHKRSHESGRGLGTQTSKGIWKTQSGPPLLLINGIMTPKANKYSYNSIYPFMRPFFGGYVTASITRKGPPGRERYTGTAFIYGEMVLLMVQTSWEHQSEGGSISHKLAVIFCKSKVLRHTSSIHSKYI